MMGIVEMRNDTIYHYGLKSVIFKDEISKYFTGLAKSLHALCLTAYRRPISSGVLTSLDFVLVSNVAWEFSFAFHIRSKAPHLSF
jgi:hypothetical protein